MPRGVSYFTVDCGDQNKAEAIITHLVRKRVFPLFLIKSEFDYTATAANYGKIQFHIPKQQAEQFVLALAGCTQDIKSTLEGQETVSYNAYLEALAREPEREPERPCEPTYADIFGHSIESDPTFVPEISAWFDHLAKKDPLFFLTLPDEHVVWLIPPQSPVAPMFYMTADRKIGLATGEIREQLVEQYNAIVKLRYSLLEGKDRVFDPNLGEIVSLEPGSVFSLLTGSRSNIIGPATYYNPQTKKFHLLTERELDLHNRMPKLGLELAQRFRPAPA